MANSNYGTEQANVPDYEEGGAGLGQEDGQPKSGADPQRENQDAGSLDNDGPGSTGEAGGYGGTSSASGRSETEGGQDMQREGSWRPGGEPGESAYQPDTQNISTDLSSDSARFDNRDAAPSADDLIEPGQTKRGL